MVGRGSLILAMSAALSVLAFVVGYALARATLPDTVAVTVFVCDEDLSYEAAVPLRRNIVHD